MESWREILYPLGFISSLCFGARALMQWLASEMQQKSVVSKLFWKISLFGNLSLFLHGFIQIQYHVAMVQVFNGVISWRNHNLMQSSNKHVKFRTVISLMIAGAVLCTLGFSIQSYLIQNFVWYRIPVLPWELYPVGHVQWWWHVIGTIGLVLFASRFWVQWLTSELYGISVLSKAFWWVSLIGDFLCLIYFARIHDPVNLIGPMFGMIPYVRNLMIIHRQERKES